MRKHSALKLLTFAAVTTGATTFLLPARADDKQMCVDSSEQAQRLRDERKLVKAREQLLACVRDACPGVIRKDCSQWLAELESSLPSVVLSARDANGHDLTSAKISFDDQPLTNRLDGKSIFVDPGPHHFKFEVDGQTPIEQQVVIREGERNRPITANFVGETEPLHAGRDAGGHQGGAGAPIQETKAPPVAAFVLGGVGIVALGSFAFFGLTGTSDVSTLRDGCGVTHSCAQTDVDAARTKLLIADISLGVGVVTLGVATYMFISGSSNGSAKAQTSKVDTLELDVRAIRGGGAAAMSAHF